VRSSEENEFNISTQQVISVERNPAVEKHEPVVCVCWNVLLLLTQTPLDH